MATGSPNSLLRLRKHADYGRVYNATRKQYARQMSFFFAMRLTALSEDRFVRRSETPGPRIGLTVGKVLGKAHERNRIKRRLRECIRKHAAMLTFPVDVILHPRRNAMDLDFSVLDREVAQIFRQIQNALLRSEASKPSENMGPQPHG